MRNIILLLILIPQLSHAGAWLQDEGKGQVITSYSYLKSVKNFDENTMGFVKQEYSVYGEYGLLDGFTVGGNIFYSALANDDPAHADDGEFSVSSKDFFSRFYLYQGDDYVISLQPALHFPRNTGSLINPEGYKIIPEMKLSYGQSFDWQLKTFIDTSAMYRWREHPLKDMMKMDLTVGTFLADDIMVMSQIFHERAMSGVDANPGNYHLTKYQFSGAYEVYDNKWLQLGAFTHIDGRNTAKGIGVIASIWYEF